MSGDILDDIRFYQQVIEDARRTVICSPDLESRVKAHLDVHGLTDAWDVVVNPYLCDDHLYVVDHNALEAAARESVQRLGAAG